MIFEELLKIRQHNPCFQGEVVANRLISIFAFNRTSFNRSLTEAR